MLIIAVVFFSMPSPGGHRVPLRIRARSPVHDHHISSYRVHVDSVQVLVVLLHHVLHTALLHLPRNDADVVNAKCTSGLHISIRLLHLTESLLRLHCTETRKYPIHHLSLKKRKKHENKLETFT